LGLALHGITREFNSTLEDWASYAERMDFYLAPNEITNAGEDISSSPEYVWAVNLQTHLQLVAPNKPTDNSYASLYNW